MNRAVVIPFHRYQPHIGEGYRVLFEYFLKNLPIWAAEFDHLYIIDSDMNFDAHDINRLKGIKSNTTVLKREIDGNHWDQYKWIIPKIPEEHILFLDHDVIINQPGIVDSWFTSAEEGCDVVASFDGSGGLRDQIHKRFPFMKSQNTVRMGSYYFLLSQSFLAKIPDFNFAPLYYEESTYIPELNYTAGKGDWFDSFGHFTIQMLSHHPRIETIEDDRSSIYMMEGGTIVREPLKAKNLGYYHIRNGNLANYVISSSLAGHMRQYNECLTNNPRELLRSLAWFYHMSDYDGDPLVAILRDMNISYKNFLLYFEEFEKYHNLKK